ncbi:MAG: MgtC/SapB family protein [Nanoarchaeota archaeon]
MVELIIFKNLFIALLLGALIGLEREYARYHKRGHDYAGIRTFPLISLFGALSALLGEVINPWILIVGITLMGLLILISYFTVTFRSRQYAGATSEVAGFLTFFIGVICYYGDIGLAAALAVVITVILYARSVLHHFAERIKKYELSGTLKFALIAFVILPLLYEYNHYYGPYDLFNPFLFWLMVVFVSGMSFVGYILIKWLGEKGLGLTGLIGGLASSMAVTSSFAAKSKKQKNISQTLALGVILANGAMFVRILIIVFALNRTIFIKILLPLLLMILATLMCSYFLWRKSKRAVGNIKLTSPFTLWPALKFSLFFVAILALVKIAHIYLSSNGVYLVSFISGLANIDAITISLSQLANKGLGENLICNGIILAAITNMLTKGGIAYVFGERKFSRIVVGVFAFLMAIGVAMILL